jgi:hypothetical protein
MRIMDRPPSERFGNLPKRIDSNPVLAHTLLPIGGHIWSVIRFLDAWFDSSDPWYANQDFR